MTNYSTIADDDLMRLSVAGDDDAFSEVSRRYFPHMRRCAASIIMRDEFAPDDVAQEALIAAYKHRDKYQQANSLKSWLVAITRQRCFDYLRRSSCLVKSRGRVQVVSIDAPMSDSPKAGTIAETLPYVENTAEPDDVPKSYLLPLVPVALSRLEPKHADALQLLFYGDAKQREVAALSNMSPSGMHRRIDRALALLRRELAIMQRPAVPVTVSASVPAGNIRKEKPRAKYASRGNKGLIRVYSALFSDIYQIVSPGAMHGQKKPPQSVNDVGPMLAQGQHAHLQG
jgi:RNA polymerase sigma factor (sigma-70 family)